MRISIEMIAALVGYIGIAVLAIVYVKVHQAGFPENEKAKFESAASNWVIAVLANLAAGLILLLVEKLLG